MLFKSRFSALVAIALAVALAACGGNKKKCVDKSAPALSQCKQRSDKLQSEVNDLKRKLAQALANPGTIKVDPDVLKIDGKTIVPQYKEGTLTQEQVVRTISANKRVLRACYERALKKNVGLRRQRITLTISFKVRNSGTPTNILVRPNYDSWMMDCMRKAIRRWRFPSFSGMPVDVETPLTLTPKN